MKRILILTLMVITSVAMAADVLEKDVVAWKSCLKTVSASDEAKKAEDVGGRLGYHEFLVEKCGFRPVVVHSNGTVALSDEDCATVYDWSIDGQCSVDELSGAQSLLAKQFDTRAFDLKRFSEQCRIRSSTEREDDLETFRKQVCQSPARP